METIRKNYDEVMEKISLTSDESQAIQEMVKMLEQQCHAAFQIISEKDLIGNYRKALEDLVTNARTYH